MTQERSLLTVKDFSKKYPAFSEGGLRYMIFMCSPGMDVRGAKAKSNGMKEAGVIVRLGRRVLIDEARFFDWVDMQQSQG